MGILAVALSGCSQPSNNQFALHCTMKITTTDHDGNSRQSSGTGLFIFDEAAGSILIWPRGDQRPHAACDVANQCTATIRPDRIIQISRSDRTDLTKIGPIRSTWITRLVIDRQTGKLSSHTEHRGAVGGEDLMLVGTDDGEGDCVPTSLPRLPSRAAG